MEKPYRRMEEYVRTNQINLREQYGNKYLAIRVNGEEVSVIDSDEDEFKLARRIEGGSSRPRIFITNIESVTNPKVEENSSPEFEDER